MEGLFDKETLSRDLNEGASCPYLEKEAAGAKIPRLRRVCRWVEQQEGAVAGVKLAEGQQVEDGGGKHRSK